MNRKILSFLLFLVTCCVTQLKADDIPERLMFKAGNSTYVTFPAGTMMRLYNYPRVGVDLGVGIAASDIKTIGVVFTENLESETMKLFYGWGPVINDQTSSNKNFTKGSKEYTFDITQADKDAGKTIYRFGIYYTNDITKTDKPAANLAIEKLYIIDKNDVRTEYTVFQTFSTGVDVFQSQGSVTNTKIWAEIEITDEEQNSLSFKRTDGAADTYRITFGSPFGAGSLTLRFNYDYSNHFEKSFPINSSTVTDNGDGTCSYEAVINPTDISADKDVVTVRLTSIAEGSFTYDIKSITRTGREAVTIKRVANDEGWTTYCNTKQLEYSRKEDMEAYIVTARDGSTGNLTLRQVDIVPPGTPAILKVPKMNGQASVTFGIPSTTLAADDNLSDNILLGAGEGGVTVPDDGYTYYALANKSQGVGFYKVQVGVTIPKGRAYLRVNSAGALSSPEFLGFSEDIDDVTAIAAPKTAERSERSNTTYDMMGRRVINTIPGNLYIRGGKKFIAK